MAGLERKRVVVVDGGYESYDIEQRVLAQVDADVIVEPCHRDPARLKAATTEADAVLVRDSAIDAETISCMRRCRIIARYGIGVDNVDLIAAQQRGIFVANVPDYGTEEVSEHALALLMSVARRTVTRDYAVRGGAWNVSPGQKMYRIAGRTLGLVGYGRIAHALERKMRGMGIARVLVYDPLVEASAFAEVESVDLDSLCQQSDFISLHAPLTRDTSRIINSTRIALMKPTAILVNTARGGLIDETALVEALRTNAFSARVLMSSNTSRLARITRCLHWTTWFCPTIRRGIRRNPWSRCRPRPPKKLRGFCTRPAMREIVGVYMSVFSSVSTIRPIWQCPIRPLWLPEIPITVAPFLRATRAA